ncbi:MAG TPA: hypothetical protein IAA21_07470 [Candidatus Blautia faecigallinarum]|uniref:Uncharacterized protein n=1 Tax=Candidatus Blautia faecigallinarum TaxID=2838488 RepID=A0A9D2IT79_9FIRM|nr:hypothetical protein [Candidatus Blautia faecigallinarum]
MSVGKASIKRAASAETKKTASKTTKTTPSKEVKTSVLTPMNSEELQVVFLKDKTSGEAEKANRPIRITDDLPDYLL